MKPRTKIQKHIIKLKKGLAPLSKRQTAWALEHCIDYKAYRLKKEIRCLRCGHIWYDKEVLDKSVKECICPHCNKKLIIEDTRKKAFSQKKFFCIITTRKGFQVIRYFILYAYGKVNEEGHTLCREVVQHWISPEGKKLIVARLRAQLFGYYRGDDWNLYSDLEIRPHNHHCYYVNTDHIYPWKRFIPNIKRNGFNGSFYNFNPEYFFEQLLSNNKFETLLKTGQYELLKHIDSYRFNAYWPLFLICIRHKYVIQDFKLWRDYIDMMEGLNMDIRNPKFICLENIRQEHDKLVDIKNQQKIIWENLQTANEAYKKRKRKYFNLAFSDGTIEIIPLKSINDFMNEGDILKHCVYASEYYKKNNSLILSARIGEERIETIEVSLTKMQVVQCYGYGNELTPYHDQILELVNKNLKQIEKIARKKAA